MGAFGAFFPLWGDFDLAFSALFQRRPRFFFRGFFFVLPICGPQTSLMKKEKTPLTKPTQKQALFFFLCFFFSVSKKAIYSSSRPLFERGEEPHHHRTTTLFLFLSHKTSNQTSAARKARKKKTVGCFASSVLSPPHKKDIPHHQSKVPDD